MIRPTSQIMKTPVALSRRIVLSLSVATLLIFAAAKIHAQGIPQQPTRVHDATALRPPAGARVALVEFADMQCPDCAAQNPLLKEAVAKYHIPWVRHDFPLSYHNWSFQAAVNARWFDEKSKAIGDEYRDQIFGNQRSINLPTDLMSFTQKFARNHNLTFPFAVDPQGKYAAMVKSDYALGQRIGIERTPTIWVVTDNSKGAPFVEVVDRNRLFQIIDQALIDTKPATPAAKPHGK